MVQESCSKMVALGSILKIALLRTFFTICGTCVCYKFNIFHTALSFETRKSASTNQKEFKIFLILDNGSANFLGF